MTVWRCRTEQEREKGTFGWQPLACLIMCLLLFIKDALFCTLRAFTTIQEQKHDSKILEEKSHTTQP